MYSILFLGPQGCGKGTQAAILAKKLGIPDLSMGNLLREAAAAGGDLGEQIAAIQRSGHLVSDEVALNVLQQRLAGPDVASGFILDGYPRNLEQFKAFDAFMQPTHVVVIDVPREVSLARLAGRAATEGRADDTPEAINRRLDIYEKDTKPVIEHYRGLGIVHEVDGTGSVDEVAGQIASVFSHE